MDLELVIAISATLWFIAFVVYGVLYSQLEDKMLARLSLAFFFIFLSRMVFNHTAWIFEAELSLVTRQNIAIGLRAVAAYLLILAALNGHRRRGQHVDLWLILFLVTVCIVQWSGLVKEAPSMISLGPIPTVLAVGWFFSAWKFIYDRPHQYDCCTSYKVVGLIFFSRGVISVMGSLPLFVPYLPIVGVLDLLSLVLLISSGVWLSFDRHKVLMSCARLKTEKPTSY